MAKISAKITAVLLSLVFFLQPIFINAAENPFWNPGWEPGSIMTLEEWILRFAFGTGDMIYETLQNDGTLQRWDEGNYASFIAGSGVTGRQIFSEVALDLGVTVLSERQMLNQVSINVAANQLASAMVQSGMDRFIPTRTITIPQHYLPEGVHGPLEFNGVPTAFDITNFLHLQDLTGQMWQELYDYVRANQTQSTHSLLIGYCRHGIPVLNINNGIASGTSIIIGNNNNSQIPILQHAVRQYTAIDGTIVEYKDVMINDSGRTAIYRYIHGHGLGARKRSQNNDQAYFIGIFRVLGRNDRIFNVSRIAPGSGLIASATLLNNYPYVERLDVSNLTPPMTTPAITARPNTAAPNLAANTFQAGDTPAFMVNVPLLDEVPPSLRPYVERYLIANPNALLIDQATAQELYDTQRAATTLNITNIFNPAPPAANLTGIVGLLQRIWQTLTTIPSIIRALPATIWNLFRTILQQILDAIRAIPSVMVDFLVDIWAGITALPGWFANILSLILQAITTFFTTLWDGITEVPGWLLRLLTMIIVPSEYFLSNEINSIRTIIIARIPVEEIIEPIQAMQELGGGGGGNEPYTPILGTGMPTQGETIRRIRYFMQPFLLPIRGLVAILYTFLLAVFHYRQILYVLRGGHPINSGINNWTES